MRGTLRRARSRFRPDIRVLRRRADGVRRGSFGCCRRSRPMLGAGDRLGHGDAVRRDDAMPGELTGARGRGNGGLSPFAEARNTGLARARS